MTKPDFNVGDTIRVKVSYPNGTITTAEGVVDEVTPFGSVFDSNGELLFSLADSGISEVKVLERAVPPNGTWVRVEYPNDGAVRFGQVFDGAVYYQVSTLDRAPTPVSNPLRYFEKWEVVA